MNYRVGSVVKTETDFDKASGIVAGTLGVVLSFERNPKTDAVDNFTVDFGARNGSLLRYDITDLTTISPYGKRVKRKKE